MEGAPAMEPRFQRRKEQLLAGCQVPTTLLRGVMSRLESFLSVISY